MVQVGLVVAFEGVSIGRSGPAYLVLGGNERVAISPSNEQSDVFQTFDHKSNENECSVGFQFRRFGFNELD